MPKTPAIRTFAARLICKRCDASRWITLHDRTETFDQVLRMELDFDCRDHGSQRGTPAELLEVAPVEDPHAAKPTKPAQSASNKPVPPPKPAKRASPRISIHSPVVVYGFGQGLGSFTEETETLIVNNGGALVLLKNKLSVGDTVFLVDKLSGSEQEVRVVYCEAYGERESRVGLAFRSPQSNFWRRMRKNPRVAKAMRVKVKGRDSRGATFSQTGFTIDVSHDGARIEGVGLLTSPGQTLQIRRFWRTAHYRVVWVGQIGTAESNQVGLFALNSGKNIWNLPLPASSKSALPANRKK